MQECRLLEQTPSRGANQRLPFQALITTSESHTATIWAARTPQATTALPVPRAHGVADQQGNWPRDAEQGEALRVWSTRSE